MSRRLFSVNATTLALSVTLLCACTPKSYTNSKVDQLLKAAHTAGSSDPQKVELALLKAVDIATEEGKGVPLMKALNTLSFFYGEQGKPERCNDLLLKAKGLGDQLLERDSAVADVPDFQTEYLTTMAALANWERDMGHFGTARRYYAVAMPLNEKLGDRSPVKKTLAADYQKCVSEQDTQEGVENLLVSGRSVPKSNEGKENSRKKFSLQFKSIMDGYNARDTRESEEMLVALIKEVRSQWGVDEPFYKDALTGLLEVVQRTGNFYRIEQVLDEDIEAMSALDRKTNSGTRIDPVEVVELGNFIDALIWQSRIAMAKPDLITADLKATRALKLTEGYYSESGLKLEECWRTLEELRAQSGDYKSAAEFANLAIQDLSKRDPGSAYLIQHYFDLGLSQLNQGQFTQAVSTADSLINRSTQSQPQNNVLRLNGLRIVFEINLMIGDYDSARKTDKLISDLLNKNEQLRSTWGLAQIYQRYRLLFEGDKFSEYVRLNENNNFDRQHFYRTWLYDSDIMSYAALRANQVDRAERYCQNVESAKPDRYSDSLYYSKIVRVWLNAKASTQSAKSKTALALDRSVKRLVECINDVPYPNRLYAVKPLVALANYLTDSDRAESAEKVYLSALSAYASLPALVDEPLIDTLTGYRKLLEKQNRSEEAWQINARLEQKKEKFSTLVSITKDTLKRANLL